MHDYDKILTRLTIVLNRLYEGESLSVTDLAEEFNVSTKTIQRDFNERLIRFPIEKRGRRWVMQEGFALERRRSSEETLSLDILEKISESISPQFFSKIQPLFSKLRNVSENPIHTHITIEDVTDRLDEFMTIEQAVKESRLLSFIHKEKQRVVLPYRIVNFEGYWYLLAVDQEDGRGKTFYLKNIQHPKAKDETQLKDPVLLDKMHGALNVWFEPDKEPITIRILILPDVVKYFQRRPISPKQKLEQAHTDGSEEISLPVTSFKEILPTLKYWIPHLIIISPKELADSLRESCESWMALQNRHDAV